jgi:hypothetical protein
MMTNTMTAAHLSIAAAEGIIKTLADDTDRYAATRTLADYRAISATIDGRVGAAIDKLGQDAATSLFNATRATLPARIAAFRRKCR